jgi:hypothetical protein
MMKPVITEIHVRTSVIGVGREAKPDMTRDLTGHVPDMIKVGVRIRSEAHHEINVVSNTPRHQQLEALNEH